MLWMTGAASDALATLLGADDGCCGTDTESTGCGKCILVQNPDAVQSAWTAIVMKKNRCPPWSSGCEEPNLHMDLAVPGFDNYEWSTANVCGNRSRTGSWGEQLADARHESHSSYTLGDWYTRHQSVDTAADECDTLPEEFQSGCVLFSTWGWRRCVPCLDPHAYTRLGVASSPHIARSLTFASPVMPILSAVETPI